MPKKKKWTVRYSTDFNVSVEAETEQEAIAKAEQLKEEEWQTSGDSSMEAEEES